MDANEKTLADQLFKCQIEQHTWREELSTRLSLILGGVDPVDSAIEDLKFCDVSYDYYDWSLELQGCDDSLKLTQEQAKQIFALGFERFWLNWADGTELYVYKDASGIQIGERKRKGA